MNMHPWEGKEKICKPKPQKTWKKIQAHACCQVVTVVDDGGNARRAPKRRQLGVVGFWQACGTKKTYLRFARSIQVPASCELPLGLCGVWGQGSVVNQKPRFIYPIWVAQVYHWSPASFAHTQRALKWSYPQGLMSKHSRYVVIGKNTSSTQTKAQKLLLCPTAANSERSPNWPSICRHGMAAPVPLQTSKNGRNKHTNKQPNKQLNRQTNN